MYSLRPVHVPQTLAGCGRPAACSRCFATAADARRHTVPRHMRTAIVAFAEASDQLDGWQGSQQDLRAMWDSVPRPLLRVGKAGVKSDSVSVLSSRPCSISTQGRLHGCQQRCRALTLVPIRACSMAQFTGAGVLVARFSHFARQAPIMVRVVTVTGVQSSHGSSLAELLAQHGLVKVQLNAACEGPDAAGAQLAEAAGAFVHYSGNLFCVGMLIEGIMGFTSRDVTI